MNVDVFLCYRRHGAQTAKLFKRYLLTHQFNGEVWYSDEEAYGNYKSDIPSLMKDAECAILFIDPQFTKDFLKQDSEVECITAYEIVEIAKKKLQDDSFRIMTVFLDRAAGLSQEEAKTIQELFQNAKIEQPEAAVKLFSQSNMVLFSTARDDEEELFVNLSQKMLSNTYYATHVPYGNFYFGSLPTSVDVVLWDSVKNLDTKNIYFENTPMTVPLYEKIDNCRSNISFEQQNNTMISLIDISTVLNDETEEKLLSLHYQKIEYRLFYKTLALWNQFDLNRRLSEYNWRSDAYQIPNAMGLAFMVITSDKKMIFTRRSPRRKVRSNEYDCSIVEGLKLEGTKPNGEQYDIFSDTYLDDEIKRAFFEEICSADDLSVNIYGLVLDKKYGQWNLVGTISTNLTSHDILKLHALREDTFEDNQMIFVPYTNAKGELDSSQLEGKLSAFLGEGMWHMALTAVYAALLRIGFTHQQILGMTTEWNQKSE